MTSSFLKTFLHQLTPAVKTASSIPLCMKARSLNDPFSSNEAGLSFGITGFISARSSLPDNKLLLQVSVWIVRSHRFIMITEAAEVEGSQPEDESPTSMVPRIPAP